MADRDDVSGQPEQLGGSDGVIADLDPIDPICGCGLDRFEETLTRETGIRHEV
jgi:hypothetical protein